MTSFDAEAHLKPIIIIIIILLAYEQDCECRGETRAATSWQFVIAICLRVDYVQMKHSDYYYYLKQRFILTQ